MKALALAIIVAFGVTFLIYRGTRRTAAQADVSQVAAAARDLPAGTALAEKDLKLINWPVSASLPGSFSKLADAIGHPLIYSIGAGEPVLARDLAPEGSGLGLSAKIPEGMRATSVRSNEVAGVAGFIFPGSHVDVLSTFTLPGNPSPVTQTILQDVEVLTVGEEVEPDPQGKPQNVSVVTLLLNSGDSQKLLLVSTQGTIQFVLRNGADKSTMEVHPTVLSQLVAGDVPKTSPRSVVGAAKPPTPSQPKLGDGYELEVIRGNNRSVEKF